MQTHAKENLAGLAAGLSFFALVFPTLGRTRLVGLDEVIYAHVAEGVARQGHWLPLHFQGHPFLMKPPLVLWIMGLAVKFFGSQETALRFFACLAAAGCVYLLVKLAAYLGGHWTVGLAAAALFAGQSYTLLYSRTATLDSSITFCYLAAFWCLLKGPASDPMFSFQPSLKRQGLRQSSLWLALAVWVKSWFAFFFFLPLLAAAIPGYGDGPNLRQARKMVAWPVLALLLWLGVYTLLFGPGFLTQEWQDNTWGRAAGQGLLHNARFNAAFYGDVAATLAAAYLPLVCFAPALFFRLSRDPQATSAAHWAGDLGMYFLLFWSAGMLFIRGFSINYFLPLLPFAFLAWGIWLGRARGLLDILLLASYAFLVHLGLDGRHRPAEILYASALLSFLAIVIPRPQKGVPFGKLLKGCVAAYLIFQTWGPALRYLKHPPDPNGALVAWLKAHPARQEGQPLVWVGEAVDGQAIEFYSSYKVKVLPALPKERPCELTLVSKPDRGIRVFPEIRQ